MTDVPPPQRISDKEIIIDITGYVMPAYRDDQPLCLEIQGTTDLFVPVFSTIERLEAFSSEVMAIPYDKIKQITNGHEFIDSIILHARIAVDPYIHDNGRLRWTEVISLGAKA